MSMGIDKMAAATTACPRCAAEPGRWCRSRTGRRASYLHVDRQTAVIEGWREGYADALRDALRELEAGRVNGRSLAQVEAFLRNNLRWMDRENTPT